MISVDMNIVVWMIARLCYRYVRDTFAKKHKPRTSSTSKETVSISPVESKNETASQLFKESQRIAYYLMKGLSWPESQL